MTSNDQHQRARELAMADRIEGIGEADRQWLTGHAGECSACAEFQESLGEAVSALRMPLITADAALVRKVLTAKLGA